MSIGSFIFGVLVGLAVCFFFPNVPIAFGRGLVKIKEKISGLLHKK